MLSKEMLKANKLNDSRLRLNKKFKILNIKDTKLLNTIL